MWTPPFPAFNGVGDPSYQAAYPQKKSGTKQKFSAEEDQYLNYLVSRHGLSNWKQIASHMNGRTVRQCRERWKYYLEPSINKLDWTKQEDELLMEKYQAFGPRWAQIANFFGSRTDIDLKNRFHRIERTHKKSGVGSVQAESGEGAAPVGKTEPVLDLSDMWAVPPPLPVRTAKGGNPPPKIIICARPGENRAAQKENQEADDESSTESG
jgi:hypothetical protein